jgi:hypothetical protein
LSKLAKALKSYKPHKNSTATVVKGCALGRSMKESHEKITFFNDASWKVYFSAKVGVLIALNSKP